MDEIDFKEKRQQAELEKIEAEKYKLDLESREIQNRLDSSWWSQHIAQYVIAIAITSALLFGWAIVYLEPILRREGTINQLETKIVTAENKKLDHDKRELQIEAGKLELDKQRLETERDTLRKQTAFLELETKRLDQTIAGLKIIVDRNDDRYFSILNSGDSIDGLRQFGWTWGSDNYYSWLGYYLVMRHPSLEFTLVVGREFELDDLKRTNPNWRNEVARAVERSGPILLLDYSYLGLTANTSSLVGGTLFLPNNRGEEFYASFDDWSGQLQQIMDAP